MANSQYIDAENLQKLRARLQKIIDEKDIPLAAIVDRTGFTEAQVRRIIYGTKNTSISNIFAIARAIEAHIMEIFIFDFKIPEYDVGFSFYRKEAKDKTEPPKKDKPISAANVLKIFANEKRFKKTSDPKKEMTLRIIVDEAKARFRSDFKDNEFSSALKYAVKIKRLKRYKQFGTEVFVYHEDD